MRTKINWRSISNINQWTMTWIITYLIEGFCWIFWISPKSYSEERKINRILMQQVRQINRPDTEKTKPMCHSKQSNDDFANCIIREGKRKRRGHEAHLVVGQNFSRSWTLQWVEPRVLKTINTQARPQSQLKSWRTWGT